MWARERGGGALEVGELRLVDYGGECSDALASDAVVLEPVEPASEGQGGNGGRAMVSTGADAKANTMDAPQNVAKRARATVLLLTHSLTHSLRCGSGKAG